jgi:ATP-binding cassette, subfamily B, bacterial
MKKKESSYNLFNFLWQYLKPFKTEIFIIILSIIIVSSAILGLGYALKHIIDQGFVKHNSSELNQAFLILAIFIIGLAVASYNRSVRVNWICEKIEANLKLDGFKNLINISPSYFETTKISDVVSRLTTDLTILTNSILLISSYSLRNALMGIGSLILLFITSIKLTCYVLLVLPLTIIPIITIGRITKKLSKQNQQEVALTNGHIEESLAFLKTVQVYNQQQNEYERFQNLILTAQNTAKLRIKYRSLLFALVIALVLSSIALILWIGGMDVLQGHMSAGSLSSFIFYSILVATSIGSLSEVYSDWVRALGALERVVEVVKATSKITQSAEPLALPQENMITFTDVSYSYPARPSEKVIKNINFAVKPGETVAIVGQSGAGKTTIFNLLLRFDDVDEGKIAIGNKDIKLLSMKDLRSMFALVTQEPVIFSASALDNIRYSNPNANLEQVYAAAKAAEIYDFIEALPEKFNSFLGEKGTQISGGQKQRIAIARAILADPKILLLDEATSSLDSENERLVQLALDRLRKNRTTIIISHRINSIINSDSIIVLDKGKVAATGTHEYLLKNSPLYHKLYQQLSEILKTRVREQDYFVSTQLKICKIRLYHF